MRPTKAQKEKLLDWVAEGLESGEINKRAEAFDPPFKVKRQQVDYYRRTRKVKIKDIAEKGELDALTSGLSKKEVRVERLHQLAALMEEDLLGGSLWLDQVKMIGSGDMQERVEYEEFNSAEVMQYRGILDDIAKELGHRAQKTELSGPDGNAITVQTVGFDVGAL